MKNKYIKMIVAIGIVFLFIISIVTPLVIGYDTTEGNTYYVAKDGNDSNLGTEAEPWLTIQKAADTAVAGDTVYVKTGIYNERVILQNSGTPGNWIIFATYPGDTVTIDGTGISILEWSGLIEIRGQSYIKISGFRIMNSGWAGIFVPKGPDGGHYFNYGGSSHITIEKNYIYNTYCSGILMQWGNNYIVDSNEIVLGNNAPNTARVEEIISIQNNVDTFEVRNNYIHNSGYPMFGGEGIDAKWNVSNGRIHNNHMHDLRSVGIYVDSWVGSWYWGDNSELGHGYARDINVYNNRVHGTGGAGIATSAETGGNVDRINIYNNIIYNCEYSILIPAYADSGSPPGIIKDVNVINNVFYDNKGGALVGDHETSLDNIVLRNNIFSQNQWWQIMVRTEPYIQNITVSHNVIDGFRGELDETKGTNYVESDPLFIDTVNADFHLQSISPAIDNGSSVGAPATDFDGVARPQGAGYDIGAYEFVVGGDNTPPEIPIINGPASGKAGTEYEYTLTTTDPDEDNVYYYVKWGDGTESGWIGPYESGETVKVNHTWSKQGTFTIEAKAKDEHDSESDWATLEVSMPKDKELNNLLFLQLLEKITQRFPFLEQIFTHHLFQ